MTERLKFSHFEVSIIYLKNLCYTSVYTFVNMATLYFEAFPTLRLMECAITMTVLVRYEKKLFVKKISLLLFFVLLNISSNFSF